MENITSHLPDQLILAHIDGDLKASGAFTSADLFFMGPGR